MSPQSTDYMKREMEDIKSMLRDGQRLRVAFDIDDVLAMIRPKMVELLNESKGTHHVEDGVADWNFSNLNSNYDEMMGYYVKVWQDYWKEIPFMGDPDLFRKLLDYHDVELLTIRSSGNGHATSGTLESMERFLKRHGMDFVPARICEPDQNKYLHFNYNLYADDSPILAKTFDKEDRDGKHLLLVDANYNRHVENSRRITRVDDAKLAALKILSITDQERRRAKVF